MELASGPKQDPLAGANQLGFVGERLCGSIGKVVRCLVNNNVGPVDVAFTAPVEEFLPMGFNGELLCARTQSRTVECFRGQQPIVMPAFDDPGTIAQLHGSSPGICVTTRGGEQACLSIAGVEVKPLDFAPFVDERGLLPRASYVDGCLVERSERRILCPSGGGNAAEIEARYASGWQTWKEGYATNIPQGSFAQSAWLGIDQRGVLHGKGANFYGQLGNGRRGTKPDVSDLTVLGPVSSFDFASSHACAVASGRVACWGESTAGQVPADEELEPELCDVDMQKTKAVWQKTATAGNEAQERAIRACEAQPRALDCRLGHRPQDPKTVPDNFRIYETDGQCLESPTPVALRIEPRPVFVAGLEDAVQVVVARDVSCALRKNGRARCWGKPSGFRLNADGSPY